MAATLAAIAIIVYLLIHHRTATAPSARLLPLVPGARVVAAAAGGSDVDSALPERFRYIAIAGPARLSRDHLIETEVQLLQRRGWSDETSSGFVGDAMTEQPVPIGAPGADVLINAPARSFYAALWTAADENQANQAEDGAPLYDNPAIRAAFKDKRAVLLAVLGNGTHD